MQVVTPRNLDRHATELEPKGINRLGSLDIVNWEPILQGRSPCVSKCVARDKRYSADLDIGYRTGTFAPEAKVLV